MTTPSAPQHRRSRRPAWGRRWLGVAAGLLAACGAAPVVAAGPGPAGVIPEAPAAAALSVEHQGQTATPTWRTFQVNVPAASTQGAGQVFVVKRSCNANEVVVNAGYAVNTTLLGDEVGPLVSHGPSSATRDRGRAWFISVVRLPTPGVVQLSLLCVRNAPFQVHFERSSARISAARQAAGAVFPRQTRIRRQCRAGGLPVGYGVTQLPAVAAALTRPTARRVGKRWEFVFVNRTQRVQRVKLVVVCLRRGREPLRVRALSTTDTIAIAQPGQQGELIPARRVRARLCPVGQTLVGFGYRLRAGNSVDAVLPSRPAGRAVLFFMRNTSTLPGSQRFLSQVVCVESEALGRGTIRQPPLNQPPVGAPG